MAKAQTRKATSTKKAIAKTVKADPKETQAKLLHLSDDHIDIAEFDKLVNADIPPEKEKTNRSLSALLATCPQGKQSKVIRDNPKMSGPLDPAKFITELFVKLSTQNLRVTWSNGQIDNWLCSPNPALTPRGNDIVGMKCGPKHTNRKRDGMAWFTALKSRELVYGFHNSQRVGIGVVSHGCIRVVCDHAKTINQNSWSGKTKIRIVA